MTDIGLAASVDAAALARIVSRAKEARAKEAKTPSSISAKSKSKARKPAPAKARSAVKPTAAQRKSKDGASEDQSANSDSSSKRKRVRKRKTGNGKAAEQAQSIDGMLAEAKRKKEQAKQKEQDGDGLDRPDPLSKKWFDDPAAAAVLSDKLGSTDLSASSLSGVKRSSNAGDEDDDEDSAESKSSSSSSSAASLTATATATALSGADIWMAKSRAQELMTTVQAHFEKLRNKRSGDERWMRNVLTSGTLADKVAAMTLLIQESPLHQTPTLESLMSMARKKGRREASMAIDALKDLFDNTLLPSRKLRTFAQQPHSIKPTDKQLLYWLLEDKIKAAYAEFLTIVDEGTHDPMPYIKRARLIALYELLCAHPEAESTILTMIVNKLGDPDRKIASKTLFLLSELIRKHPGMKIAVASEIERLLFRSNVTQRAQYFAVIWLNQLIFGPNDGQLAQKLITIYFTLFKLCMDRQQAEHAKAAASKPKAQPKAKEKGRWRDKDKKKAEAEPKIETLNSKLLAALLTGVNRAFPFAQLDQSVFEAQTNTLFRLVHTGTFNASIQALMLLFHVMSAQSELSARFYRALYDKLLSPELAHSSKHALFLNLVFKACKNDVSSDRIAAFVKRLLQVSLQADPPFICGVLYLISEVLVKAHANLRFLITETPAVDEEEKFHDLPAPDEVEEVGKQANAGKASSLAADSKRGDGDGEAYASDADDTDDEAVKRGPNVPIKPDNKQSAAAAANSNSNSGANSSANANEYDPRKRDPLFANAKYSCLWELSELSMHFHPSVAKFARILLSADHIEYAGDPLKDFTSVAFLDRFVYRNPKASAGQKTGSRVLRSRKETRAHFMEAVNTPAFLATSEDKLPDDEVFFHRFFTTKQQRDAKDPKKLKALRDKETQEDDLEAFADRVIQQEMDKYAEPHDEDFDDAGYAELMQSDSDDEDQDRDAEAKDGGEGEGEGEGDFEIDEKLMQMSDSEVFDSNRPVEEVDEDELGDASARMADIDADADADADADDGRGEGDADDDEVDFAKLAAASAGDGGSDSEQELDFGEGGDPGDDDGDGDFDMLDADDQDDDDDDDDPEPAPAKKGRGKKKGGATFASADDFAELLEDGARPDHPKLLEWQRRKGGRSGSGKGKGSKRKAGPSSAKGRPAKRGRTKK